MFGLLMAGVTAGNLRSTVKGTGAYSDPFCNTFSADGSCCIKCSHHYFMNQHGACTAVSDWCKTWDEKTGCCTSCFVGYGEPVDGVCAGNVGEGDDHHDSDSGSVGSGEGSSDCESGEGKKMRKWKKKEADSCEESHSGNEHGGKWKGLDRFGYNNKFGHKFGGKFVGKYGDRKDRESKWFSKKSHHKEECD